MMKHTKFYLLVGLLALASGCAFHRQHVVLAPVGPPPVSEAIRSTEGYLVVHSDLDVNVNDPDHNYHSSYKIFSSDGALVLTVPNHTGSFLQDPATVNLSPGRYKVVARTSNLGTLTVPVVIEEGKTTSVHLDGSEITSGKQTSTADFVHLPDGLIVGWRARESGERK